MPFLRWKRTPVATPPLGVTVTTDGDGTALVEGSDRGVLCNWQLDLMKAGKLTHDDLCGGGEGAAERVVILPTAAQWAAIQAAKTGTKTQLVAAIDAVGKV